MIFIGFILFYSFILAVLIAAGIAVGYLLHWMIPVLSLETSLLIGVISVNSTLYFFAKLLRLPHQYRDERNTEENIDIENDLPIFVLPEISQGYSRKRHIKRK